MQNDAPSRSEPQSPFDKYISELMTLIADRDDIPSSNLNTVCVHELQWLPGFCDVVITILRTNRLIQVYEWEPGRLHITDRGRQWVHAHQESISLTQ